MHSSSTNILNSILKEGTLGMQAHILAKGFAGSQSASLTCQSVVYEPTANQNFNCVFMPCIGIARHQRATQISRRCFADQSDARRMRFVCIDPIAMFLPVRVLHLLTV